MELYELHVSQNRAGAPGQRRTLPETAQWVGAVSKQSADPTSRNHDLVGRQGDRTGRTSREQPVDRVVFDNKAPGLEAFENFDRPGQASGSDERAHDFAPGSVPARMDDPRTAVRRLEPQHITATARAIEASADTR